MEKFLLLGDTCLQQKILVNQNSATVHSYSHQTAQKLPYNKFTNLLNNNSKRTISVKYMYMNKELNLTQNYGYNNEISTRNKLKKPPYYHQLPTSNLNAKHFHPQQWQKFID
eukprot:TRINITY_DN20644_c0_g1_i1.p2 TRINITY_DN20644_c0_g1~~TRINITY_DN20644_c0_g1_i1.p2  ORF type:complete len:112 (-),score=1.04 TRINITY_DN20644_c0_g1_i1:60-395(-)